jgi:AraC-like DNA-binding protein
MTLVLSGDIRENVVWAEEFASALSVVVKPADVRHANEIGPRGAHTLQILFDPAHTSCHAYAPVNDRWRWLHAQPAAAALLAVLRGLRSDAHPGLLQDQVTEAVAAVAGDPLCTGAPPVWLRRIREAVDDNPQSVITVGELARAADLHAVSLSRAFRRHYGCSLTEYRRAVRLRRAAAAIESSRSTFSRIAYEAGFADHSHLTRTFQSIAGLNPTEFRKLAQGG